MNSIVPFYGKICWGNNLVFGVKVQALISYSSNEPLYLYLHLYLYLYLQLYFEREGEQIAHRHCIIQIGARAEPKKRLKGLDRPRALYHSRPLLLLQKLASFRHKLAEPKNANSMLIGCLEKCHTKVAKGQRGEDICTWQKEVKPYREKEKWFSKLARWLVWRCR